MQLVWKGAAANDHLTLAVNYKLELRERRSTLGSNITSAEILVPEKCRLCRGRRILQGPLAGLWQLAPVRGACKAAETSFCSLGRKLFLHL